MSQNNDDLDYYNNILNQYNDISLDKQERDILKYRIYMNLMDLLADPKNTTLVKNSILLMLSLFEDIPPDFYNNQGLKVNKLSRKDRKILFSNLKGEL